MRYCGQCNRDKPDEQFRGKTKPWVKMCADCRMRRPGGGYIPMPARHRLRVVGAEPLVIWRDKSLNEKLGPIGSATVSAETCPPSCKFYGGNGCYAEQGHVKHHWQRTEREGLSWADFLSRVRQQPAGAVWRYAVAGDLPGVGESVDVPLLASLVAANAGRRGHSFTHKPLATLGERHAVRQANLAGFTINLSANDPAHADALADLGIAPVAVVLPAGSPTRQLRSPAGRPIAVCPAQTHKGITCAECQVCTRSERVGVVGFIAHGQRYHEASRVARNE